MRISAWSSDVCSSDLPRLVPIVADEARTFGMEGLFRQIGIYAPHGQKYKPVDADQLMYYREDAAGQVPQEGITEVGAFAPWLSSPTGYRTTDLQMLPEERRVGKACVSPCRQRWSRWHTTQYSHHQTNKQHK